MDRLRSKAMEAAVLVLVIAFVAHLAWEWLQALVPALLALVVLAVVYTAVLGRRRH